MKMMFFILYVSCYVQNFAQNKHPRAATELAFFFLNKRMTDSADIDLKIVYKNNSTHTDSIYQYFVEGYFDDEESNISIEMEKFDNGKYSFYPLTTYNKINKPWQGPSDRCLELPKKIIQPKSVDTVVYNLLSHAGSFEQGKYRLKAHVRTGCRLKNGRGTDYNPGGPTISYVSSKWIYFEVTKLIQKNEVIRL